MIVVKKDKNVTVVCACCCKQLSKYQSDIVGEMKYIRPHIHKSCKDRYIERFAGCKPVTQENAREFIQQRYIFVDG